jgi:iron complex transport system substrate-binding protein
MTPTPQRIICLSAEAADWLWRLGAWEAVVGVTAYFELPAGAAPRPPVSGFSSASIESILRLDPDLVIAFSDIQAGIVAQLIARGCSVLATNQRTLNDVEATLTLLARCVNRIAEGDVLLREFQTRLSAVRPMTTRRPRVYFEEWDSPLITGIAWVSELIERAGGEDVFSALRSQRRAPDRVVSSEQVLAARPEIIFASWCGKPVSMKAITSRKGWESLPAIQHDHLYELNSAKILQPGFGIVQGYEEFKSRVKFWSERSKKGQPL